MRIDLAKWCIAAVTGTILVLGLLAYAAISAALPRRYGSTTLVGLSAPLEIELDEHAIPRVRGASFEDALRGEGYMHAQERYFEMDLMRRSAAGELAALVGERALALDRSQRPFDFRRRAEALLTQLPAEQRGWLEAYAQGVNAGLADLGARPPEYWLLRSKPLPWRAVDSLVVAYAFYTMLSNNDVYERPQGVMHAVLPPALYEFLTPSTLAVRSGRSNGRPTIPTGGYTPLPIPGPDVVDLRTFSSLPVPPGPPRVEPPLPRPRIEPMGRRRDARRRRRGDARERSASRTAGAEHLLSLRALLAGRRSRAAFDSGPARHLDRRERFPCLGRDGQQRRSKRLGRGRGRSRAIRSATSRRADRSHSASARLKSRSRAARARTPRDARRLAGGPSSARLARPAARVARHVARARRVNLDMIGLPHARTAAEGAQLLAHWAGPSLNWMLADTTGDIGWIVNGPLPRAPGFDGSRPESWADGTRSLARRLPIGRSCSAAPTASCSPLTTAHLPRERAATLSRMWMRPLRAQRDRGAARGARAARRVRLPHDAARHARSQATTRCATSCSRSCRRDDPEPLLAQARASTWRMEWPRRRRPGRVSEFCTLYYRALLERVLGTAARTGRRSRSATFVYRWPLADEPLRRVLEERPANLLTKDFADWPTFLRQVLLDCAARPSRRDPERPGVDATWGEVNRLDVAHPFAALARRSARLLARWLRLPAVPLPGSTLSLRVATPNYGALIRMAVAPAASRATASWR